MSVISSTDFEFEEDRLRDMVQEQNHKLDAALHVQFYKHAELNTFKTKVEGRKIFEEYVYVRILMPANRLNIIERRATEEDRRRFRRQFVAFVEKGESLQLGTPLDQVPNISASQVLELKALKIETVEQLAGMPDATVQLLGTGGQELKQRAIKFLDRSANAEALSAEVKALREELAALRAAQQIASQAAQTSTVKVTTSPVK